MIMDGMSADEMRAGFIPADDVVKPCPFCGAGFVKPVAPVAPIVFHPGTVTDGECALSGMGFREHQWPSLNRRAPA